MNRPVFDGSAWMRPLVFGLLVMCTACSVAIAQGVHESDESYEYDENGDAIGLSTAIQGLELSVRKTSDGTISAPGLPTLTLITDREADTWGRVLSLTGPGGALVTYTYCPDGSFRSVELSSGLGLQVSPARDGTLVETVTGPGGRTLKRARIRDGYGHGRWHLLALDLMLPQFGLSDDWFNELCVSGNSSGTIDVVRDGLSGETLFYLLKFGALSVGFDPLGQGLFYDLLVDAAQPSGVAPTRIVVTRDLRVQTQAFGAPDGGIETLRVDPTTAPPTLGWRAVSWTVHTMVTRQAWTFCGWATACTVRNGGNAECVAEDYYCDYDGLGGVRCYDCERDPDPSWPRRP
jgi:hypothetical protein